MYRLTTWRDSFKKSRNSQSGPAWPVPRTNERTMGVNNLLHSAARTRLLCWLARARVDGAAKHFPPLARSIIKQDQTVSEDPWVGEDLPHTHNVSLLLRPHRPQNGLRHRCRSCDPLVVLHSRGHGARRSRRGVPPDPYQQMPVMEHLTPGLILATSTLFPLFFRVFPYHPTCRGLMSKRAGGWRPNRESRSKFLQQPRDIDETARQE